MENSQTIPNIIENNKDKITFSVEILPSVRGDGVNCIFDILDEIKMINPLWVDVTSHSASIEWVSQGTGSGTYKKNQRRRFPGTIAICAAIKYKYNYEAVPHMLCYGFSKEETEDALIDLEYLGLNNVLAIRGNEVKKDKKDTFTWF